MTTDQEPMVIELLHRIRRLLPPVPATATDAALHAAVDAAVELAAAAGTDGPARLDRLREAHICARGASSAAWYAVADATARPAPAQEST